jgi:hypothetical protein
MRMADGIEGMDALRALFPDAQADQLNLVLFSTSGCHGTYNTIENAERFLANGDSSKGYGEVTFLIIHPRLVAMRYGVCNPETQDDIDYLKRLRASSHVVVATIGIF